MHRGDKMLFRKAYKNINNWYNSSNKKVLLIDGTRQIGKTYLIREFLKEKRYRKSNCKVRY